MIRGIQGKVVDENKGGCEQALKEYIEKVFATLFCNIRLIHNSFPLKTRTESTLKGSQGTLDEQFLLTAETSLIALQPEYVQA
ncbi:hypothetical protein GZ78_26060 [Endozoicomonas numazuensis]|uniref:Uncharacterized protein n=1 Tax=Endozoicomonas numazuensis TaxID=1137799 RepID=A0A081N6L7_9GAMM|nr:hypothetical protein GZ78_26060 [Endozoicomonas numazuensis]